MSNEPALSKTTTTKQDRGPISYMIYIYIGPWTDPIDDRAQELCESRGGRPGLSVLTSLLVSVDEKQY